MPLPIDERGQHYGHLLVHLRDRTTPGRAARWWCLCDCGSYTSKIGGNLRAGGTKSCGSPGCPYAYEREYQGYQEEVPDSQIDKRVADLEATIHELRNALNRRSN